MKARAFGAMSGRLRGAPRFRPCASADASLVLSERSQYQRRVGGGSDLLEAFAQPVPDSFYALLRVAPAATEAEIRYAFRSLQKNCHPDVAGQEAHDLSLFLNIACATLCDPNLRGAYDAALHEWRSRTPHSFDGTPVSGWAGNDDERDAVFVDETVCIGCGKCSHVAPATFFMEEDHGRARVATQWADAKDAIQEAVELCPVSCISYVLRTEVALLEHVMALCERENIAVVTRRRGGNFGAPRGGTDPWARAAHFIASRRGALPGDAYTKRRPAQDDELAAALGVAWLQLKPAIRERVWPEFSRAG